MKYANLLTSTVVEGTGHEKANNQTGDTSKINSLVDFSSIDSGSTEHSSWLKWSFFSPFI